MTTNRLPISAVTFDVWETLIKDSRDLSSKRAQLRAEKMALTLRRRGYSLDASHARMVYAQMIERLEKEIWSNYLDAGTAEHLRVFLAILDPQLAASADETLLADLDEAYTSPIFDVPPLLAKGADWALGTLQLSGVRLGLICNTGVTPGRDIRRLLDGFGVLKYFEALTFSDEEGLRKPRPEMFLRTLTRLGVSPLRTVHVGDDARADIAGAKGAGMMAVMVSGSTPAHMPLHPDVQVDDLFSVPDAVDSL